VTARFSIPITAMPADIDELGHVSNLVYVRWVFEVAMAHTRAVGWNYEQYRELGSIFVVRRHEIDYVASVTVGQAIVATTWVESFRAASCIRKTELTRDGVVVSRAASTWAFLSLGNGRPQRIPEHLVTLFTRPVA